MMIQTRRAPMAADLPNNSIPPPRRIPLTLKLLCTAFVAVLVPYYWSAYGPRNFLYFCDVALLLTLVGMWTENSLLISMEAVAIVLPQMIWVIDFLGRLLGLHLLGMTNYMFDPTLPLFVRGLSLFHGWLPFLLLWLLTRVGYDRRALPIQTIVGVSLLLICYFGFVPPTSAAAQHTWRSANINYVFGLDETKSQTALPPLLWLGILLTAIPLVLYVPTHFALRKLFKPPTNHGV